MRALGLLAIALWGGCLDDALGIPFDAGPSDFAHRDLAQPLPDLFGVDLAGADLSAPPDLSTGCTTIDVFWSDLSSETRGSPTEAPFDYVTWTKSLLLGPELSVEIWHDGATQAAPYTLDLPGNTNYLLCEVCVLVDLGYDPGLGYGSTAYLALGGSVTVEEADTSPSGGSLSIHGSNVHFVEWDFAGDRPKPGGGCYDITSFALAGEYSGDGGNPPRWK